MFHCYARAAYGSLGIGEKSGGGAGGAVGGGEISDVGKARKNPQFNGSNA